MTALAQVGQIARRSILRTARQPANIIFPFVFPTALLAVTSAGLHSATKLPGFPSNSCQPCQGHGYIALRWPWQCSIHVGGTQPVVALPQVAQVRVSHHALSRSRLANSRVTVSHIALPRLSK